MPVLFKTEMLKQDVFIWEITEPESTLISALDEHVICPHKHPERRLHWLATQCLLQQTFRNPAIVLYNQHGKPIINEHQHLSISHSGTYVALARASQACGVDVQKADEKIPRIANKFIHEKELDWIAKTTTPGKFMQLIWSIKEAVFKIYGTNIAFKENIYVPAFTMQQSGSVFSEVNRNNIRTSIQVAYRWIGNSTLVYAQENLS